MIILFFFVGHFFRGANALSFLPSGLACNSCKVDVKEMSALTDPALFCVVAWANRLTQPLCNSTKLRALLVRRKVEAGFLNCQKRHLQRCK